MYLHTHAYSTASLTAHKHTAMPYTPTTCYTICSHTLDVLQFIRGERRGELHNNKLAENRGCRARLYYLVHTAHMLFHLTWRQLYYLRTCASVHVLYLTLTHNLQQKVVTPCIKECKLALHDITELNRNMSQSVSACQDQSGV